MAKKPIILKADEVLKEGARPGARGARQEPAPVGLFDAPVARAEAQSPAPAPSAGPLEYRPLEGTAWWRVEKWELLRVEFLEPGAGSQKPEWEKAMAEFAFWCQGHARLWLLVRRLYGVGPVIPPPEARPDDLRAWSRAELEADGFQVKPDLEALGLLWRQERAKRGDDHLPPKKVLPGPGNGKGELGLDDGILERFQFPERLFEIKVWDPLGGTDGIGGEVPRPAAENRAERDWFVGRVKEWAKMLGDGMGGPIARSALMNDLYLRRLESEIATASPRTRPALYEQKTELADQYDKAVAKLQEMFPEMATAGRVSFHGSLSDVVAGYRDYYAFKDRRLVDKFMTALEVELAVRASAQAPERYRFSLNLAVVDCISGLLDPEYRPLFKPAVLKKVDAAVAAALTAAREASGERLVDLESGVLPGEGDEFEDLLDAECPHCGSRISSGARKCAECRKATGF